MYTQSPDVPNKCHKLNPKLLENGNTKLSATGKRASIKNSGFEAKRNSGFEAKKNKEVQNRFQPTTKVNCSFFKNFIQTK